jgi:hypothetical protein
VYKYSLSNKRRSDCPFCGKRGKYSAYMNSQTGELAPVEYGMCSSCRESKRPPDNFVKGESAFWEDTKLAYYEADTIHVNLINCYYKPEYYVKNNFIEGLEQKFGNVPVKRVVDLYKLGRFYDSGVVFPYQYTDNHICTGKIMFFDNNLKRIKEGKKSYPKFLHNLNYQSDGFWHCDFRDFDIDENGDEVLIPFKLKMCLFGHNQVVNDKQKTICLVESEKTAVIMSIVLPDYIWVATGGLYLIQDYKFLFFTGRKCIAFPDMSENDIAYEYWFKKLTDHSRKYGFDFELVDYYSEFMGNDKDSIQYCKTQLKLDVADFVMHFNKNNSYTVFIKNKLELVLNNASVEA